MRTTTQGHLLERRTLWAIYYSSTHDKTDTECPISEITMIWQKKWEVKSVFAYRRMVIF